MGEMIQYILMKEGNEEDAEATIHQDAIKDVYITSKTARKPICSMLLKSQAASKVIVVAIPPL